MTQGGWRREAMMKGSGDEGKWWRREVVRKGSGEEGKWWWRGVVRKGSGEEGKWWWRGVATKGSGEEGKWWRREVMMKGSGDEGKWWGREVVKGSGDEGKWWRREVMMKGEWWRREWWGREVVKKGSGDEGKWWRREVMMKGSGDEGKWWGREVVKKGVMMKGSGEEGNWQPWRGVVHDVARVLFWGGSRSTKPCVFPCKAAAAGDERYLVCAAGAAGVVSCANWFLLCVLQRVVVFVCVVLCVSWISGCGSHWNGCVKVAWATLWGGSRSTKPCVFPYKVAAAEDERYLVCAAGAAGVVSCANWFLLYVLQRVVVFVCVVLCVSWISGCGSHWNLVGRKPEHETLCFSV